MNGMVALRTREAAKGGARAIVPARLDEILDEVDHGRFRNARRMLGSPKGDEPIQVDQLRRRLDDILLPPPVRAIMAQAAELDSRGEGAAAVSKLREAVELAPNCLEPRIALGHHFLSEGDLSSAQVAFMDAVRVEPDSAEAHADLAAIHIAREQYERAEDELRMVLRLDPDNPEALLWLMGRAAQKGRIEDAIDCGTRFLHVWPAHSESGVVNDFLARARPAPGNPRNRCSAKTEPFKDLLERQVDLARENRFVDNHWAWYYGKDWSKVKEDLAILDTQESAADHEIPSRLRDVVERRSYLFDRLDDDGSRELLVAISAFAVLGHRRVRMPGFLPDYHQRVEDVHRRLLLQEEPNEILSIARNEYPWMRPEPARYDITGFGGNACYTNAHFLLEREMRTEQYSCRSPGLRVEVEDGDVVLDCGACMGDTAVFFAMAAGPRGRIHSFEPHPGFAKIVRRNMELNPELAPRMVHVPRAVTGTDGETLQFKLGGAGSALSRDGGFSVKSASIDAYVAREGLQSVDFVKMDIEGAEPDALRGAATCLRKFRPKLAISLYHDASHFDEIPRFLDSLGLGYRFRLGHYATNQWETVLYARSER